MEQIMNKEAYDRLTPARQEIVNKIIHNIETDNTPWKPGWTLKGGPRSVVTNKRYRGVNNLLLTLIAMERGYEDNRWVTFKQMQQKGWTFKENKELPKAFRDNQAVPIEYFNLIDKNTQKIYTPKTTQDMSEEEKKEYISNNVVAFRKCAYVYNLELVKGPNLEPFDKLSLSYNTRDWDADLLIDYWNKKQCPIVYDGGDDSYYSISLDEIHMPMFDEFESANEYYLTLFHEMAHSTGHKSRLNRKMKNKFGTENYAVEELRAEIASIFIDQDLDIPISQKSLKNNSAYIKSWGAMIRDDPNALFKAIADAEKISQYVLENFNEYHKEGGENSIEHKAELMGKDLYAALDDKTLYYNIFKDTFNNVDILIPDKYGGIKSLNKDTLIKDEEEAKKIIDFIKQKNGDITFTELSQEKLYEKSIDKAEDIAAKELSDLDIKPSLREEVIRQADIPRKVDMTNKGLDSLAMLDREVAEKAFNGPDGDKFKMLYLGESLYHRESRDERSLMLRIALYANGNLDQICRIFKSSGQYREDKDSQYITLANEANQYVYNLKKSKEPKVEEGSKKKSRQNEKVKS